MDPDEEPESTNSVSAGRSVLSADDFRKNWDDGRRSPDVEYLKLADRILSPA